MSYHLSYERLCMAGLDDCNILQLEHLVWSRLGETQDSFNIWNLSILWLCMFKCQAMCHVTDRHLAQLDLRETRVSRRTQYPTTQVDQGLWMSAQVSHGSMVRDHDTMNRSHMGNIISPTNWARSWSGWSKASNALWTWCMTPTIFSTRLRTTWWKI
jgi:hypothetical protein